MNNIVDKIMYIVVFILGFQTGAWLMLLWLTHLIK